MKMKRKETRMIDDTAITGPPEGDLASVVERATKGNPEALEQLVRALQGGIYGLALRMLGNQPEAEDATQEILVRIVTRLAQFDGRSKVTTWAYRVAVNFILDMKKSAAERMRLDFEQLAKELAADPGPGGFAEAEESFLVEEVKIGCSLGMLQCLDRPHRMAFVLGEILELSGPEAAEVLDILPDLFRKRLQKARATMVIFMQRHCGLVSDGATCRCHRQAGRLSQRSNTGPKSCEFAAQPTSFARSRQVIRHVEQAQQALHLHRTCNPRSSSVDFARRLMGTLGPRLEGC